MFSKILFLKLLTYYFEADKKIPLIPSSMPAIFAPLIEAYGLEFHEIPLFSLRRKMCDGLALQSLIVFYEVIELTRLKRTFTSLLVMVLP